MGSIGPLSSNSLGLFRTASSNVLTQSLLLLKKNANQSNALLDALDKSDPAKAKKIRDGQSALSQTIEKLQSAQKEDSAQRKEAAKQKIERIKAQIQSLRLQASVDPKAAARQAANLSRELANAAREYAGSTADSAAAATALGGGSVAAPASTASVNATVNAVQSEAKAAQTDTAAGTAPEATALPKDVVVPKPEEAAQQPGQEEGDGANIKAAVDEKIAAASEKIGASAADQEFAREARRLLNELKNIIKTAKEKIEAEDGNNFNQDIHDSENALREAERYINDIGAGALATTVTTSVDILV